MQQQQTEAPFASNSSFPSVVPTHPLAGIQRPTAASMRLLALSLLAACAHALHSSEVGVTDWHKALAGVPLTQSPATAPIFHRRRHSDGQSTSIVLTATQSNVLAAFHSTNGSLGECIRVPGG